jgi:hypothetical protein
VEPVVENAASSAEASRRGSRGSTRIPAAPTISGSAPTVEAMTGTPQAIDSIAGSPALSETTGSSAARAPRTSAAQPLVVEPRRVDEGLADVLAGGRTGERRAIVGRRAGEEHPGGHGSSGSSPAGRPASDSSRRARRSVLRSWRAS